MDNPLEDIVSWLSAEQVQSMGIVVCPANIRTYKGKKILHPLIRARCKRQYKRFMRHWNKAQE